MVDIHEEIKAIGNALNVKHDINLPELKQS